MQKELGTLSDYRDLLDSRCSEKGISLYRLSVDLYGKSHSDYIYKILRVNLNNITYGKLVMVCDYLDLDLNTFRNGVTAKPKPEPEAEVEPEPLVVEEPVIECEARKNFMAQQLINRETFEQLRKVE